MSENNYNPWAICTDIYSNNLIKYTQRNNTGLKCCHLPNIQDIIYSLDSEPALYTEINSNNLFIKNTDSDAVKIGKYLTMYEKVVKSCLYFKDPSNDKLSLLEKNYPGPDFSQLDIDLKNDFIELYEYALRSANLMILLFTNGTTDFNYVQFNDNNIKCVTLSNSVITDNTSLKPVYFIYEDSEEKDYYVFIPICVKSFKSTDLQTYNSFTEFDFKINAIRNCTQSNCSFNKFYTFSGQNISGNVIYESRNKKEGYWYQSDHFIIFVGVASLLSIILILVQIFISKKYNRL